MGNDIFDNSWVSHFHMPFCNESEWRSTAAILMNMIDWSKQMIGNCTYLLPNTRPTHTENI